MANRFNLSNLGYIVVGDVHGDMNQLLNPLFMFISRLDKYQKIIYLGDYSDRGFNTPRIYEIISVLHKCEALKNKIIFLKGNHECVDDCTYDYVKEIITGDHSISKDIRVKSYMYKFMNSLDLDIVYYDDVLNILFSHSPISRPLAEALKMNSTKNNNEQNYINTTTMDKPNSKMEYQNIHGHDHILSSISDITKFEEHELKMLSLDGDSSIGFDLMEKKFDYKKYDGAKFDGTPYKSKVIYLTIEQDQHREWKYKLHNEMIPIASKLDINSMPMNTIQSIIDYIAKNSYKEASDSTRLLKYIYDAFGSITMKTSCDEFVKLYLQEFPDDPKFENLFSNIKRHSINMANSKKSLRTYFIDVPREVYRTVSPKTALPRNELITFLYILTHPSLTGGNVSKQNSSKLIILLITTCITIIITSIIIYYSVMKYKTVILKTKI